MSLKAIVKSKYFEIALIGVVFLLSFVSFSYYWSATETGSYYQSIIAALMGTMFTVVITSFLLKQQARSEELREQNVEVFKKKVEKYENLISLLSQITDDGVITRDELRDTKKSIYEVSLFCGKDTLDLVASFLKQEVIGNVIEEERVTILDITAKMREELNLEGITTFDKNDLKPIEFLIDSNLDLLPLYKNINSFIFKLKDSIEWLLYEKTDNLFHTTVAENLADTISFTINRNGAKELDFYVIEIKYPEAEGDQPVLRFIATRNSGALHSEKDEQKILEASKTGMEFRLDEELPNEIDGFKYFKLRLGSDARITSKHQSLAKKIMDDIVYIDKALS